MTLKHRRKFTREFKVQVLAEIAAGKSVAQAAREHRLCTKSQLGGFYKAERKKSSTLKRLFVQSREHQLHPTLIGRWQKHHRQYADRAFAGNGHSYTDEARVAELERMVGRLTMENDLLKKALQRLESLSHRAQANSKK
jgi:transposase